MSEELAGRAIAITGSGGGLGRAYALAVARAGAAVVVNDVDARAADETRRLVEEQGARCMVVVGSVADVDVAERIVEVCSEQFGRIDGLVNNAAVLSPGHPLDQADAVFARTVEINILGTLRCGVAALSAMRRQGSGALVNVVSGASQGLPGLSLYGATKGAVLSLTYGLALEMAGTGVRVNAISPLAQTSMSDSSIDDESLIGGRPESVTPAVVYLLSDRAAGLNGQIVRFDGRRLGLVSEPHLDVTTTVFDWTPERIGDAFDGALRKFIRPIGLASSPAPVQVELI